MKPGNAKIYAPYNALKGLYETLKEREVYHEEKRDLSEDQMEYLNYAYSVLRPGMHLGLTYYDSEHYENSYGELTGFKKENDGFFFLPENADKEEEIQFKDVYDIEIG